MRWLSIAAVLLILAVTTGLAPTPTDPQPSSPSTTANTPAGASFLARAEEHIAAREYWASPTQDGLQAPNRRHDLRSFFEPTGVRVHDRKAGGSPELVELQLSGVGRGERLSSVAPGEVTHHEGRVEIHRKGLVEWYENSERGLEQGFTLAERPSTTAPGELVLELSITGARASLRGDDVALATDAGRKLAYGKLAVVDANGDRLLARFEVPTPDRVRLIADDSRAVYPIVIDPLLEETADAVLESNQASAGFGVSVASAGDVNGDGYADVIVGAPSYDAGESGEGAAFVFLGSTSGLADANPASAHAQLESDQASAQMGQSVASAGDVNGDGYADVIVGAPAYDSGLSFEGAAFIFLGSAAGIVSGNPATAHAQFEANWSSAGLGQSVASAGDINADGYADVIVGAPGYGAIQEGAAFIFLGSATGIADGDPVSADTRLDGSGFQAFMGTSVASAGDVNGDGYADVIVGAPQYANGEFLEGAAFIFLGSASGIANGSPASAHARLEGNQIAAFMGHSVASAGDVNGDGYADVIVGARLYSQGQDQEGSAFVFQGSATGIANGSPMSADSWIQSDQVGAQLGTSVASAGDVNGDGYSDVIVGAPFYDAGQTDEGAAFVYLGGATGVLGGEPFWAYAQLESNQASAAMGTSVASAGDVNRDGFADVIIGVTLLNAGQADEGAAFVYYGGGSGIASGVSLFTADGGIIGDQADAYLGAQVASAGDVNGDGYADVIVGAPYYDAGETDEGAAFVYLGSPSGIALRYLSTAHAQLEGDEIGARMGGSVASAGDVNGDGYGDVIVGRAPTLLVGQVDPGAAFVFLGSASGIADGNPSTAHARLEGDQFDSEFGGRVASAGDVNGDGYGDVIVTARRYNSGQVDEGAAFIFLGSVSGVADGNPLTAHARFESNQVGAYMGWAAASAGDVNGDGFGDVIVGAVTYDAGENNEGAAFLFLGSASGIADGNPLNAHARFESNQAGAGMGYDVASAGDVNGDGYGDVIVGAVDYNRGQNPGGGAYIFLGSATGIASGDPLTADTRLESDQIYGKMGWSVASAGDVNGDGFSDVIVGAPLYSWGLPLGQGAAFVFLGSASGIAHGDPLAAHALIQASSQTTLGSDVASAGDVNGDGFSDVIVWATSYGEIDEGAAFVYLGNSKGRPTLARQRRADGTAKLVQPWGAANSTDAFQVELLASHPSGLGRVRAEVEACPAGVDFDDVSCAGALSPGWIQLVPGTADPLLSTTLSGLVPSTLYRWRARILYADATGPIPTNPAHGPWRRLGGQSVEGDIRTVPEPGALAGLLAGCALLFGLRRRHCT